MSIAPVLEVPRTRDAYVALASLFRYPDRDYARRVSDGLCALSGVGDDAVRALESFAAETSGLSAGELQAIYTSTFDLAPSCSPYLGVHLFGEEERDRTRLLVGLRMEYAKCGVRADERELPDHIAEVFSFAGDLGDEEWLDLVRLVIPVALLSMDGLLRSSNNPYRHLIAAARHLSGAAPSGGES